MVFPCHFSGGSSRMPIVICEINCNGKESHLSECQIKTCDKAYPYHAACTKQHIVGVQCSKYIVTLSGLYSSVMYTFPANSTVKEFISGKVDDINDDNENDDIRVDNDNEGSGDKNFDDEDIPFNQIIETQVINQRPSTATSATPEIAVDYWYDDSGDDDGLSGGAIAGIVVSSVVVFILLVIFVISVIMLSYHRYRLNHTYIITHRNPTIMVASCSVTTPKPVSYAPSTTFSYTSYAKGYKKVPITDYSPISSSIGKSAK